MFIYSGGGRAAGENVSKAYPAGANRPEGPRVCRKECGKKRVWAARAFQFLGNRRPISARAKSTPVRRRSAASIPSATILLAFDRRNRCCAGSRDFAPPPPPPATLPRRIFLHACRIPLARSRSRPRPTPRSSVLSTPGARWWVCVAVEKPPAMIAVYGREKPSRSVAVIAILSLSRNSNRGGGKIVAKNEDIYCITEGQRVQIYIE